MQQGIWRPDIGRLVGLGAIGGIIAGLVFAMFVMLMGAIMTGSFFGPLRLIAATVVGPAALEPAYPLLNAILIGVGVHLVLSALFGVVFGLIVAAIPMLASSSMNLILSASIYGFLLWFVNIVVIAVGLGIFPGFAMASTLVLIIAHTFFYGTVLGFYLSQALPTRRDTL